MTKSRRKYPLAWLRHYDIKLPVNGVFCDRCAAVGLLSDGATAAHRRLALLPVRRRQRALRRRQTHPAADVRAHRNSAAILL